MARLRRVAVTGLAKQTVSQEKIGRAVDVHKWRDHPTYVHHYRPEHCSLARCSSHDKNSSRGPTTSRGPESAHNGDPNRPVALRLNSRKRVRHRTYFSGSSADRCVSGGCGLVRYVEYICRFLILGSDWRHHGRAAHAADWLFDWSGGIVCMVESLPSQERRLTLPSVRTALLSVRIDATRELASFCQFVVHERVHRCFDGRFTRVTLNNWLRSAKPKQYDLCTDQVTSFCYFPAVGHAPQTRA